VRVRRVNRGGTLVLAAAVFLVATLSGALVGQESTSSVESVKRQAAHSDGRSGDRGNSSRSSLVEDLGDLGLPGIVGAVLGAVLGWGLTTVSERQERARQEKLRRLIAAEEAAALLDQALADASMEGEARIAAEEVEVGLDHAREVFSREYGRYALRLVDDRVVDRMRAVIEFCRAARALPPPERETVDFGLNEGFRRIFANARASLESVRRGDPLPEQGILEPNQVVELLPKEHPPDVSPFYGLQQWLQEHPADPAVQRVLDAG
jgi:hypothetical protein